MVSQAPEDKLEVPQHMVAGLLGGGVQPHPCRDKGEVLELQRGEEEAG